MSGNSSSSLFMLMFDVTCISTEAKTAINENKAGGDFCSSVPVCIFVIFDLALMTVFYLSLRFLFQREWLCTMGPYVK